VVRRGGVLDAVDAQAGDGGCRGAFEFRAGQAVEQERQFAAPVFGKPGMLG
jgi:hypothetical protein